ncbi:MAG: hypothetical protein PSX80_06565 [bacterium]|nr:hypothetical protein [bacterium]
MVAPVDTLTDLLNTHFEWLAIFSEGRAFPLRTDEMEIDESPEKTLIGLPGEKGFRTWRVQAIGGEDGEIVLALSRNLGVERQNVRLIPRTPAAELAHEIEIARLLRANHIARLLESNFPVFRIVRVALNEANGRMANILVESPNKDQTAILADVTNGLAAENLLASAFLWLDQMNSRRKKPVQSVWIVAERKQARALRRLHTLLRRGARSSVTIVERADEKLKVLDEWTMSAVWREKPRKLSITSEVRTSKILSQIVEIDPEAIDTIRSKQGETARFHGLPFARTRTLMGRERSWFGVGKQRRPLLPENIEDLAGLVDELDRLRRADAPNSRHEYYRSSPELWLESILKRDIRKLDANLILSPIYNQFRSSTGKIDLLALRRDGRLVLIELKTSPDRHAVFQAADYWRKIELQRRRGVLAKARLFGELEIKDEPTLVYVVAPGLSFHHDFEYFARMLSPEIELWRFELHKDWRREIKVIARHEYR